MDIRHLRHFLAVADELHFGRAAGRLNMEQAPLSQSIKRFEADLGVTLFDRSRRGGTRLTQAGAQLLDGARETVAKFDLTISTIRDSGGPAETPISVGFVTTGVLSILPTAIKRFHGVHPDVRIKLVEASTPDLVERVRYQKLDFALINDPPERPSSLTFELLRRDAIVAALPVAHPLAGGDTVSLHALATAPMIFHPRAISPGLHDGILKAFSAAGQTPRIGQEAQFTPTILSLVSAGLGYALIPESAKALPYRNIVFLPVADLPTDLTWGLHLVSRPDMPQLTTKVFGDFLREAALD
jgi:DNA-binding transcriptional LysR family regulator